MKNISNVIIYAIAGGILAVGIIFAVFMLFVDYFSLEELAWNFAFFYYPFILGAIIGILYLKSRKK